MIFIDYKDRRPIYEQIVERFQLLIVKGILEPDSQMPSVRKLATDLAINPNTIQKAYTILEQEGFIYPVKGRGNFVTGGEKLVRQKQETFLRTFRETLRQAKEMGIEAQNLKEEIEREYEEGEHDRHM
ncbi:MAG: GntR family transcriptional regulator [Eubacteriales bacterium]|nr:GntR family transcriptional regulator [Eubacteriales bacterium]